MNGPTGEFVDAIAHSQEHYDRRGYDPSKVVIFAHPVAIDQAKDLVNIPPGMENQSDIVARVNGAKVMPESRFPMHELIAFHPVAASCGEYGHVGQVLDYMLPVGGGGLDGGMNYERRNNSVDYHLGLAHHPDVCWLYRTSPMERRPANGIMPAST